MKGFSPRNLKYMRAFAEAWPEPHFVQQLAAQIPWFHNCVLLDKVKSAEERVFYVQQAIENGTRRWIRHDIDTSASQYHDLQLADIDADGRPELITGKRYRAHCGNDPGSRDDIGIYYFKWNGETFSKQVISHGPLGVGAGCGIHFEVADLDGNGRLDIVAPGKDGLYVFYNEDG